jgi:hypothetical protein
MQNNFKIVLDTSYLESIQYNFESAILKRADVYISEIVDREIRHHLKKSSIDISKGIKNLPAKVRNVLVKEEFLDLNKLEESVVNIRMNQYKLFLEGPNIKIIKNNQECCIEMFERYFAQQPPFSSGKKKDEFPDAMALLSVTKYFKEHKIDYGSVLIATGDKDWQEYCQELGIRTIANQNELSDALKLNREGNQ